MAILFTKNRLKKKLKQKYKIIKTAHCRNRNKLDKCQSHSKKRSYSKDFLILSCPL